jgi:predicted lipoprotein
MAARSYSEAGAVSSFESQPAASATAVITRFVAQSNRGRYLQDVAANINTRVGATTTGWQSYTATFQKSEGTAVGSAVGNLVNQLNSDIDMTKRAKVGIPSGRFTAGTAQPTKVEAYYSGLSLPLLKSSLQAEKAMFLGQNTAGANGLGLDDYLDHVGAKYNNEALSAAISRKFDEAIAATDAVQGPLSQAVTTQPQAVGAVYQKLQELIVLTKTDMPAALGVSITYTDNDGD